MRKALLLGLAVLVGLGVSYRLGELEAEQEQSANAIQGISLFKTLTQPSYSQEDNVKLMRGALAISCDPSELKEAIVHADALKKVIFESKKDTYKTKTLYALGALTLELWLNRCLQWWQFRTQIELR